MTRTGCEGRAVAAPWLVFRKTSKEGGNGGRGVGVKSGWDRIFRRVLSQRRGRSDAREDMKVGEGTSEVEHVADRRSDVVDLLQSVPGSKVI